MPDEGLWVAIVVLDEVVDGGFEFLGGTVDAAAELAFGEQREPAFDQIEPGGRGGREVNVEAGPFGQPVPDQLRFVGAVVVQDQVNVQFFRHMPFDGVEEVAELRRAVALLVLADDRATPGVEGGEEAGGAVALVVVGAPLRLAGAHGQQRRGSIEGLYLRLLVDTQNQRPVGRVQIQAHDVAHLVDEERIAAELEGLYPVRSERKDAPDAADRRLAESGGLGHVAG